MEQRSALSCTITVEQTNKSNPVGWTVGILIEITHKTQVTRTDSYHDNDNDNDHDHSFSQLPVHKALTCPEVHIAWVVVPPLFAKEIQGKKGKNSSKDQERALRENRRAITRDHGRRVQSSQRCTTSKEREREYVSLLELSFSMRCGSGKYWSRENVEPRRMARVLVV